VDNNIDFSTIEESNLELSATDMKLRSSESSEQTISRVLSGYDIGRKLRALRLRKKIALVDLGKHTGLSASMLSQLENGKLVPTLATLARIAMVFDVGLDHFFGARRGQKTFSVVRAAERLRFPDRADTPNPAYFFECLAFAAQGKGLQAYVAEFPHRQPDDVHDHAHEGAELIYVLEGSLGIRFEGEEHLLKAGDSVYFDATEPHAYRGASRTVSRAVVVTTPPRL
jgi:transcriptional regulator with XRE-family HTH domain